MAVGERLIPLLVPSVQLPAALGLALPDQAEGPRYVWDIETLHARWEAIGRHVGFEAMTMTTPSRGRTVTELVANSYFAIEKLIEAWATGVFLWGIGDHVGAKERISPHELERLEAEEAMIAGFTDHDAIVSFLERRHADWQAFAVEVAGASAGVDLDRETHHPTKGAMAYSLILGSQRWHMAMHFTQMTYTFDQAGIHYPDDGAVEAMADLPIPAYPF